MARRRAKNLFGGFREREIVYFRNTRFLPPNWNAFFKAKQNFGKRGYSGSRLDIPRIEYICDNASTWEAPAPDIQDFFVLGVAARTPNEQIYLRIRRFRLRQTRPDGTI